MHPALRSHRPLIMGRRGAVATNHPVATQAGLDVLRAGGTAVDATIAVSLMLGVVEPAHVRALAATASSTSISRPGRRFCVNATGAAPLAATPEAYRDGIPVAGPRSTSTPGLLAGLALLHAATRHACPGRGWWHRRSRRRGTASPRRMPTRISPPTAVAEAAGQRRRARRASWRMARPRRWARWWCSRNWRRRWPRSPRRVPRASTAAGWPRGWQRDRRGRRRGCRRRPRRLHRRDAGADRRALPRLRGAADPAEFRPASPSCRCCASSTASTWRRMTWTARR